MDFLNFLKSISCWVFCFETNCCIFRKLGLINNGLKALSLAAGVFAQGGLDRGLDLNSFGVGV